MSAHKVVIITCDGCGTTALSETLIISDLVHLKDPIISVADARQQAHAKGWTHTVRGKDLCQNCQPGPSAPRKHHVKSPHTLWHIGRHS